MKTNDYFNGKYIWITGASSGIGEALALALSQLGAKLILSARRLNELERVKANCASPETITLLPLDICKFADLPQQVSDLLKKIPQIDMLINNAGIGQRGYAIDTLLEVDEQIMRTNFMGTVALTKAVLPHMLSCKAGHIVTVSSVVGYVGVPYRTAYSASKHALQGYFKALKAEISRHNIDITLVCPGYIKTNISYHALNADGSKHARLDQFQARGMSAMRCAHKMLRGIARKKAEIIVGGIETYGIYLQRFAPKLLAKILTKVKTHA